MVSAIKQQVLLLEDYYSKKYGEVPKSDAEAVRALIRIFRELIGEYDHCTSKEVQETIGEYYRNLSSKGFPAYLWMIEAFHVASKKSTDKRTLPYCIGILRSWMKHGFGHIPSKEESDVVDYFLEAIYPEHMNMNISINAQRIIKKLMGTYGVVKVTRMISSLLQDADYSLFMAERLTKIIADKFNLNQSNENTVVSVVSEEVNQDNNINLMKEEFRAKLKDEVVNQLREEYTEIVKGELKVELLDPIKQELRNDLEPSIKDELRKEKYEDIRIELEENLKHEIEESLVGTVRDDLEKELRPILRKEIEPKVREELWLEMVDEISPQEIEKNIRLELTPKVEKQLRDELSPTILDLLKVEFKEQYKESLINEIKNELKNEVKVNHEERLIEELRKELEVKLEKEVERNKRSESEQVKFAENIVPISDITPLDRKELTVNSIEYRDLVSKEVNVVAQYLKNAGRPMKFKDIRSDLENIIDWGGNAHSRMYTFEKNHPNIVKVDTGVFAYVEMQMVSAK